MLGAVIGDIVGSVYERNNVRRKDFSPLFHPKAYFTDDTVCTVAVADALVNERHAGEALTIMVRAGTTPEDERDYGLEDGGERSRNILAARPRKLT
ncbi:MAG: hypothetical protein WCY08_06885 [Rhodocyclaceae bacterium]